MPLYLRGRLDEQSSPNFDVSSSEDTGANHLELAQQRMCAGIQRAVIAGGVDRFVTHAPIIPTTATPYGKWGAVVRSSRWGCLAGVATVVGDRSECARVSGHVRDLRFRALAELLYPGDGLHDVGGDG